MEETTEAVAAESTTKEAKNKKKNDEPQTESVYLSSKDVSFDVIDGVKMHSGSINSVKFSIPCDKSVDVAPEIAEFLRSQTAPIG